MRRQSARRCDGFAARRKRLTTSTRAGHFGPVTRVHACVKAVVIGINGSAPLKSDQTKVDAIARGALSGRP
jgi:hypothetical protein